MIVSAYKDRMRQELAYRREIETLRAENLGLRNSLALYLQWRAEDRGRIRAQEVAIEALEEQLRAALGKEKE